MFVAFEGGDGAGKTTQLRLVAEKLRRLGREVVVTHEPGDSRIGEQVCSIVLDGGELDERAEALLFAADRADHVASVIRPALTRGAIVLTSRYVDSSLAYQGVGRNLGVTEIAALSEFATQGLVPDLTVVLDVSSAVTQERVDQRQPRDRIERVNFHEEIRQAFRDFAAKTPERYLVVDGARKPEDIADEIVRVIEEKIA